MGRLVGMPAVYNSWRHELFNAQVKKSTGQLENTAKLKLLRRDIARVETLLHERRGAVK